MTHPDGRCPGETVRVRFAGDPLRAVHNLCAACQRIYTAPPFSFVLVPDTAPEWVLRARERRLPPKVA
jgi:hypothetical protein